MHCVCWNIRGTDNHDSCQQLWRMVREFDVKLVCVLEPMNVAKRMKRLGVSLRLHSWMFISLAERKI